MSVLLRIEDLATQTPPREVSFSESLITIGRDDGNVLVLADATNMISRRHAAIRSGPAAEVMDLGSRNATFLNDQRLEPQRGYPLASGDVIRLGPFRIAFLQEEAPRAAPPDLPDDFLFTQALSPADARRYHLPDANASREQLHRAVADLHVLNELAIEIGASHDAQTIMQRVVQRSIEAVQAEQGLISLLDEQAEGSDANPYHTLVRSGEGFHLNRPLRSWMVRHRRPLLLNDVRTHPDFQHVQWEADIRGIISVPLLVRGELQGLLSVCNKTHGGAFSQSDLQTLSIIAAQSAQIIENARLFEEQRELMRMQQELEVALEIQTNLLPKTAPVIEGYEVAGHSLAAQAVGGDHFDHIQMANGRWALCVGDVSGKGLPAALVMANLQATLRAQTLWSDSVRSCIEGTNRLLYESTNRRTFVTLFYGVLDPLQHTLSYANAGHNPPFLCRNDSVSMLERGGLVLGAMRSLSCVAHELVLHPGDMLVIYSDGVVEARNPEGDLFGDERLEALCRTHQKHSAKTLISAVMNEVKTFARDAPQSDDITLLVLKRQR